MRKQAVKIVVAFVCGGVMRAGAQEVKGDLPEVVVTATRTQTRADDVTASVAVVTHGDIDRRGQDRVADALRGAPGVDVTEFGTPGRSAFASIRGSNPDQVLVQLDGVEVNTPTVGQFDFANLPTDNVDRVEILRGGGGALYGSEAIGGVINVITRRGEGPFHIDIGGEAGSAATHHETVGISGARGPLALSGRATYLATDGFQSINDDSRNFSTVWRADADVLPEATARGFLRYTTTRAGLANFNVAEGRLDPDARSHSDFFLAKTEWAHAINTTVDYRLAASIVRDNLRFRDDEIDSDGEIEPVVIAHFPSEILAAETQVNHRWRDMVTSTIGVDFKERSAQIFKQEVAEEKDGEPPEVEVESFRANRSSVGVYAQEQVRDTNDVLHGVGGVRYDAYDGFGDEVTWSGSGSYLIRPSHTRLRLGYAEGFRAPTFDELFELGGNPELQAERSWEISGGLTQSLCDGRLRLEPTYFYRNVSNFIDEIADELPSPIAGIPESSAAHNIDVRFHGLEFAARAQPWRWLTVSGTYMYLHTTAAALPNRPQHRGSAAVTVERSDVVTAGDGFTGALVTHVVGSRDSADPTNDFAVSTIGSYARVDLALTYRFAGQLAPLRAQATVRNLFNRDYSESIGFPAPPARFLIGLHYAFGELLS